MRTYTGRNRRGLRFLWLLPAAILLAAVLYCTGLLYPGGRDGGSGGSTDWMAQIGDDRPLSLINIPGTHDSGTRFIFPAYFLQDQDTSIARQLENGYRYLDVRVALNRAGDGLELIHAFGTCRTGAPVWSRALTYDSAVADTLAFLEAHPSETVIFCVKPERSGDDPDAVRELLEKKISEKPDRWFIENRIPSLGEVRGRIVFCRRYEGAAGLDFNWADQGDPAVLDNPVAIAGNGAFTLAVQDRYHYSVPDKWNAVLYTMRNPVASENTFCLNFLSTAQGKLPHPRSFAAEMNELFLAEPLTGGSRYGILLFDFADAGLAQAVIGSNLMSS